MHKISHLKTSPAIPLPGNIISMPCSDQPSHSQEQSTKRVALEDLRCVHIEENINSSLATIGAALKIRAVPGWKTYKGILSFKECFYAIKTRNLKTIRDALQCTFGICLIYYRFENLAPKKLWVTQILVTVDHSLIFVKLFRNTITNGKFGEWASVHSLLSFFPGAHNILFKVQVIFYSCGRKVKQISRKVKSSLTCFGTLCTETQTKTIE